ncbi:TPA: hypothetical protein R5Z05_001687, partial [Campylobacter coli]|nr:hypothetical protein [Campylobacter coli]
DLFITVCDINKYNTVKEKILEYGFKKSASYVYMCENIGRNVLPWFLLKNHLSDYDVVGHFHTKRSSFYQKEWFGDSWNQSIYSDILKNSEEVFRLFADNHRLGIVIPDIPFYFRFVNSENFIGNYMNLMQNLWDKMECDKYVNFNKLKTPIMSYGMMFWYRPKSLDKLINYDFSDEELKSIEEPLGIDGTILHAFERMLVYVAWSEGYDFKILTSKDNFMSGFDLKNI